MNDKIKKVAQKAKEHGKAAFDRTPNEGKADFKHVAMRTIGDVVVGMLAGGTVGAALGKWSLLPSVILSAYGHYANIPLLSAAGVGMMSSVTSSIIEDKKGLKGVEVTGLEGAKERLRNFAKATSEKFFLDKVLNKYIDPEPASAAPVKGTAGLGEVQYYSYPEQSEPVGELGAGEIDYSVFDKINEVVAQSGQDFAQKNNKEISGLLDETDVIPDTPVSGLGSLDIDPSERNY